MDFTKVMIDPFKKKKFKKKINDTKQRVKYDYGHNRSSAVLNTRIYNIRFRSYSSLILSSSFLIIICLLFFGGYSYHMTLNE